MKRIDKSKIYNKFYSLCEQLLINCSKRGYTYVAISGFRDPKEQAKLYAQGRSTPGKIVTNAKPWTSFHNFGLAIDFAFDTDSKREGLQPGWNLEDYEVLREEAKKIGLISGMDFKTFKEGPHIQFNSSLTLKQMQEIVEKQSLEALWRKLDELQK